MTRMWRTMAIAGSAASALSSSVAFAQACPPGVVAQPEVCNQFDDDCDGWLSESPEDGGTPLCSEAGCAKRCIDYHGFWTCAKRYGECSGNVTPCFSGEHEEHIDGDYLCVPNLDTGCKDCPGSTALSGWGETWCAPEGTVLADGTRPPICVCKGRMGCREPCYEVTCTPGSTCTDYGPNAGRCVLPTCYNVPCPAGQACLDGACTDNPCKVDTCGPEQACKPDPSFTGYHCTPTCQTDSCGAVQVCVDGLCVPQPCPVCGPTEVCDPHAGVCIPSQCPSAYCADGSTCNPLTGVCGAGACEGVVCPAGTACHGGECWSVAEPEHDGGIEGDAAEDVGTDASSLPDTSSVVEAPDAELQETGDAATVGAVPGTTSASEGGCSCSQAGARGGRGSIPGGLAGVMTVLQLARKRRRA